VVLVSLLTAWETQMVKELYYEGDEAGTQQQKSIFGAFALYGSFVSIFVNLLQIFGFLGGGDE
jgi:FtsH-binding integral membrane protein